MYLFHLIWKPQGMWGIWVKPLSSKCLCSGLRISLPHNSPRASSISRVQISWIEHLKWVKILLIRSTFGEIFDWALTESRVSTIMGKVWNLVLPIRLLKPTSRTLSSLCYYLMPFYSINYENFDNFLQIFLNSLDHFVNHFFAIALQISWWKMNLILCFLLKFFH